MSVQSKTEKPKEVFHDQAPSQVVDHAFEPRAEWWTLCKHCSLAESAHAKTSLRYVADDMPDDG